MTTERKIVFGLQDIRAVSYECNKCHARTTFPLGYAREPIGVCYICNHRWRGEVPQSGYSCEPSAYTRFLGAATEIKTLEKETGFKMVFELDEISASGHVVSDRA